jgi:hypothetical protein
MLVPSLLSQCKHSNQTTPVHADSAHDKAHMTGEPPNIDSFRLKRLDGMMMMMMIPSG